MKSTNRSGLNHRMRHFTGAYRMAAELVCGVVLGLLLPQVSVYDGLMPFGVGLAAAASGPSTILVYLSSMIGYLWQGSAVSLRYVAALVAVAGIRWAVSGFRSIARSRLFSATVAFVGVLITGSALVFTTTPSLGEVLIVFAESVLTGGFAYFVSLFIHELSLGGEASLSEHGKLSVMIVIAVTVMAFFNVEIVNISPARILSGLAILLAARCGRLTYGASVGALFGCAVLLADPELSAFAPAFALGGVLAGIFSEKNKWLSALMYVLAVGIIGVQAASEMTVLIWLYEALAAGIIFVVMPLSVEVGLERVLLRTHRLPEVLSSRQATASKMDYAAKAMTEVVGTVDTVSCQLASLGAPDIGGVCRESADVVCRSCKQKTSCWETHFSDVMDALNHTVPVLKKQGKIETKDLCGYWDMCLHKDKMADSLTSGYREFLIREGAYRRLNELRSAVYDQFAGMAKMLEEFAARLEQPEWADVETEKRLRKALLRDKWYAESISCRINDKGRMCVEIQLEGHYVSTDKTRLHRKVSECCGRRFSSPLIERVADHTRITLTELTTYRVLVGAAQIACKGESLCGDAYEVFRDSEGSQLLVLSDGMGSGGRAAVDSAMTVGLASRLLKAGFGYESVLRLINTALMTKSEDESLSTLDVVDINLFTGSVKLLKAGAGASLLYSRDRIYRIEESSLPLGILREVTFAQTNDQLTDGDVLITMSDGVSNGGLSWVEGIVREHVTENGDDLCTLAEAIAEIAREQQKEDVDDITVLVAKLQRIH